MPKTVRFYETGPSGVLRIEEEPRREPGPGEVRLRLEAFGLNRSEVLYRQGMYLEVPKLPSRIGYEGAGTVEAAGTGVDPSLVGRRMGTVPGFSMQRYGLWAEEAIVPAAALAPTPANLPPEAAAAPWMPYVTAYGGLVYAGEMQPGQHVLLTAGSSSVALAAIQIANDLGATSIVTTRTSQKRDELLSLGAGHVIATEEENVVARVKAITGGEGVAVVFDAVAGRFVETLAKCAAMHGVLVEYGGLSLEPVPFPFRASLHKQLTMRGYTLHQVTADAPRLAHVVRYITERLENGTFVPKIARVFRGLESLGAAQDYMETNAHVGKIVVVL